MTQIEEAFGVFRDEIYAQNGDSVMCSIHEAFGGLDGVRHNCLGCNLADATSWIHNCLHSGLSGEHVSLEEFYFDYLIKLYLLVERIYVVFEIIVLPLEYRGRHFSTFQRVHKWANFIKHPKSFLLVHHPRFFMEGDTSPDEPFDPSKFGIIINQDFVLEYYGGPENNAKLHKLLTNKTDVAVLFPNIVELTRNFSECIHEFVSVIRNNAVYREVLNSRSTYDNYFEKPPETTS